MHLVCPVVFKLWPPGHDRAGADRAELADGAVDDVDSVEEVHHMHGNPVVVLLIVRELHRLTKVQPRVQGGLNMRTHTHTYIHSKGHKQNKTLVEMHTRTQ